MMELAWTLTFLMIFQTSEFHYSLCFPVSMAAIEYYYHLKKYFKALAFFFKIWKHVENGKYNNRRDEPLILCEAVIPPTFQRVAKR